MICQVAPPLVTPSEFLMEEAWSRESGVRQVVRRRFVGHRQAGWSGLGIRWQEVLWFTPQKYPRTD